MYRPAGPAAAQPRQRRRTERGRIALPRGPPTGRPSVQRPPGARRAGRCRCGPPPSQLAACGTAAAAPPRPGPQAYARCAGAREGWNRRQCGPARRHHRPRRSCRLRTWRRGREPGARACRARWPTLRCPLPPQTPWPQPPTPPGAQPLCARAALSAPPAAWAPAPPPHPRARPRLPPRRLRPPRRRGGLRAGSAPAAAWPWRSLP
mmetsp:Transcript_18695/g.59131  ORF Transcript_18695/g.59131 Transcript_18695/m.59131 type:complete len:206 (-) Transcript_18695:587-1204(-)